MQQIKKSNFKTTFYYCKTVKASSLRLKVESLFKNNFVIILEILYLTNFAIFPKQA